MGYIKEPAGIDFVVDPKPLSTSDIKMISEIIAYYKATGRKMPLRESTVRLSRQVGTTTTGTPARRVGSSTGPAGKKKVLA